MTTLERFKDVTYYANDKGPLEKYNKNHRRQYSVTLSEAPIIKSKILQNKSGVRRMESPIPLTNNNLNSQQFVQDINQYLNSFKKERRLQTIGDYSSLNSTINTLEKENFQKSPFQISLNQIGLEKRRLKTLKEKTLPNNKEKYTTIQSQNIQQFFQKPNDTSQRSKTLQTENLEGFDVYQFHDNLVNYQKVDRPRSNVDNYKTIQQNQASSVKRNDKRLNLSQIQESKVKELFPITKDKHNRVKSYDPRYEKIKPIIQKQAEKGKLQNISTDHNSIYYFHALDSKTTEDQEQKINKTIGQYKVKNKNYVNNNFNYKLKLLRGVLKRNQLSPENFTCQKVNTEIVKENSIILEENPSQYNLNSLNTTTHISNKNGQKFDTEEQKDKKNQILFQIYPQRCVKNKDILSKFLTKTKQIKSKSFIENLETDNTYPDDSCLEQSNLNTIEDFKTFYLQQGEQKENIQINENNQKSIIKQKINKTIEDNSKRNVKNNGILNNNINHVKPFQNLPQQPYNHPQQKITQGVQNQRLLRKSIQQIHEQTEKKESIDSLNISLKKQQKIKQICGNLNNTSKPNQDDQENSPQQITKEQNYQNLRKSYGSPLMRDNQGLNSNTITYSENASNQRIHKENRHLSRDEIELNKFNEEKKKNELQKFAPYKIDQYQQLINSQNIQSQQKIQNQLLLQNNQPNSSNHINNNQQHYSFSFQYQQNSDPQILQQQILEQTTIQSGQQIPFKNIQGFKTIQLAPVRNEGNYGMPVPTNFGVLTSQQQNEFCSPNFSQQFYESDVFKIQNQCKMKNSQQSRKNSLSNIVNMQLNKLQGDYENNIVKISQLSDQCPPTPKSITLDYLQKRNEQEDSYHHTAFYNNQQHLKSPPIENEPLTNKSFQLKTLQASQTVMSQQNTKPIMNDSALQEVTSIQINSNYNIDRIHKNFGSIITNGSVNDISNQQIIFSKTNSQLKAETLIQQAKYYSQQTKINGLSLKKDQEPRKSLVI